MKKTKCPHCKSKKGIEISSFVSIRYDQKQDFKGNIIDIDKVEHTSTERYARCLNCEKLIESEYLKII